MEIVAATGNAHKVQEMQQILAPKGVTVISAASVGGMPEVVEDGSTFAENACKKASQCAMALHRMVMADDSGLEVMALNGAPGIYSARYAGEGGNDGRNLAKLLRNLEGVEDRRARFVCVIAVADASGKILGTYEGEIRGRMAEAPHGTGGFGYDPAFIPEGYEQTFGELPAEIKNSLSHRARALEKVAENLSC